MLSQLQLGWLALGSTTTFCRTALVMGKTMIEEPFVKQPIQNRETEIVSRCDAVRVEMASAVRLLGDEGTTAKEQTQLAARRTGLSWRVIERLRYRKIGRIAADVADAIREAVAAHQAKQEALARHEITILTARLQALESRLASTDADFFGEEAIPALQEARRQSSEIFGLGAEAGPRTDRAAANEAAE